LSPQSGSLIVFKGLANLASLMKQAHQLSSRMKDLSEELRSQRVVGSAGGGLVEVEANGLGQAQRCRIDPSLFSQGDREVLEDLIVEAFNQAAEKAKTLHAEAMQRMASGIDMPGLDQALNQIVGNSEKS
jgi:hypothetical protein